MAMGIDSAMRIMMTEIRYGKMFFVIMRCVGVPSARDARLYSRSRMIMTRFRISRAMGSQPVMHMAIISVLTQGFSTYVISTMMTVLGMLSSTLYSSVKSRSSQRTYPQSEPMVMPINASATPTTKPMNSDVLVPLQRRDQRSWPMALVPKMNSSPGGTLRKGSPVSGWK